MTATSSSYLRFLPPVLAQPPDGADGSDLGAFLLAFERVLTGLPDTPGIPAISDTIAGICDLFDPWQAPAPFLPWLASWLALDFPTLPGRRSWDDGRGGKALPRLAWDEYQQRKAIAEIARIHAVRGLRDGLNQALNLLAVTAIRPRVAVDDGSRVWVTAPRPDGTVPITALVNEGPRLNFPLKLTDNIEQPGLVRPQCIAATPDGGAIIGDLGAPELNQELPSSLWHLAPGRPPLLLTVTQPATNTTVPFARIVAVTVHADATGTQILTVCDKHGANHDLWSITLPADMDQFTGDVAGTPLTSLPVPTPAEVRAMAIDVNGDILLLASGITAGPQPQDTAQVIVIDPTGAQQPDTRTLQHVTEPVSLLVLDATTLIVGDGADQSSTSSANLVSVDRSNGAAWTETPLLPSDDLHNPTKNPLVTPTAIVSTDGDQLLVLDAGLRPLESSSLTIAVARPPAIYEVDLRATERLPRRATDTGSLVRPTGMARVGPNLFIADPGQIAANLDTNVLRRECTWLNRLTPCVINVIVHFESSNPMLPTDPGDRRPIYGDIAATITAIVDQFRPAHSTYAINIDSSD